MSGFSGEYLGFTLGNIHSSQLNITRVVDGNRYNENLLPNLTDSTAQIPGGDGTYYWDTSYTQKPFTINFAFDDLGEEDIRRLKHLFGFKGIQELIFDEFPHKKYMVKCAAPPVLRFIPFGRDGDLIIYKGEGTVSLVAYYPYAISTWDYKFTTGSSQAINNVGDLEAPFKVFYTAPTYASSNPQTLTFELKCSVNGVVVSSLKVENLFNIGTNNGGILITDSKICVDMKTHLIEGLDSSGNKTGHLYNRFITTGDFFNLPVKESVIISTNGALSPSNVAWSSIEFNCLYY